MGKCIKCGTNFVGTPENPQPDGLCRRCEIIQLKADNAKLRKALAGLVRLWRKEARNNLKSEWAYKNQKPISLNRAAFENGLALAKQQCAEQLRRAAE